MPTLSSDLRNRLERVVIDAREVAEAGARAALEALAVRHHEPYLHMKPAQRALRNHLRARARQLGDRQDSHGRLGIDHLVHECAYEHWHRMLFARFLAENDLLIDPEMEIAISLAEAEELAKEEGVNVWVFASRCAERMLPQIFRPDDPLLQVSFATEHMLRLERLLASLPAVVFTASDALGWVYQFWQSKKKDEVNKSEVKIGADELPAVTQLFTEPYMVHFLLHNTLGAWWAGKKLAADAKLAHRAKSEDELRAAVALPGVEWEYLRFVQGDDGKGGPWRPAAGMFETWPKTAAELKVLDPCCGSGHFLVAALLHLVPIRMAEEGLSAPEAVDAVLRDNLHGLEIDERCCQIAAFALAFEAWKMTGYRPLPQLNIACSGIGPQATEEEWLKLAEQSGVPLPAVGREAIQNGLLNLHRLFSHAPTLGSLIDPAKLPRNLIAADYKKIQPYLAAILKAETSGDELRERAVAADGMVKAAELLAGSQRGYTLVITNVPYLGMRKQCTTLKAFCSEYFPDAKEDLATVFCARISRWLPEGNAMGVVAPQNQFYQYRYRRHRRYVLESQSIQLIARLGEGGFQSAAAAGAFASLSIITCQKPLEDHCLRVIDVAEHAGPENKASALEVGEVRSVSQRSQLNNPDARLSFERPSSQPLLKDFVTTAQGIKTGDDPFWVRCLWEIFPLDGSWQFYQTSAERSEPYTARSLLIDWRTQGKGMVRPRTGSPVIGKSGVVASAMREIAATLYDGDRHYSLATPLIPLNQEYLAAIWAYCSSPDYNRAVREIEQNIAVTTETLAKVPFDLAHWQKVAAKKYAGGLPEPESDDPTQWLFHGRPEESGAPLQVAVARLLGYRWPAELDDTMRLSKRARELVRQCDELPKFADDDGIVCIPSVRGEQPGADRLLAILSACGISPGKVRELAGGIDLDDWLRNDFFEGHCKLFHDRPFIWHIWDGRKRDGFHALVNYHKLGEGGGKGRKLLESLTYSYVGEWITREKDGVKRGQGGAEDRLAAALELQKRLEAILEGERPFDIFVRWKPLHEQPIGWEPDINDGVRVNIRPFLTSDLSNGRKGAGILRFKPNIRWSKDRGKEPERPKAEYPWFWGWDEKTVDFMGGKKFDGNRWNDCHYSNKVKQQARDMAKKGSKP